MPWCRAMPSWLSCSHASCRSSWTLRPFGRATFTSCTSCRPSMSSACRWVVGLCLGFETCVLGYPVVQSACTRGAGCSRAAACAQSAHLPGIMQGRSAWSWPCHALTRSVLYRTGNAVGCWAWPWLALASITAHRQRRGLARWHQLLLAQLRHFAAGCAACHHACRGGVGLGGR